MIRFFFGSLIFVLASGLASAEPPKKLPEDESLKKASVNGKYQVLLMKMEVENDYKAYKEFREWGRSTTVKYAGHKDIPKGYWVYVYPHWYVWGQEVAEVNVAENLAVVPADLNANFQLAAAKGRPWGPEQAIGPPDTPFAGDFQTAWAALTQNGRNEWMELTYEKAVVPVEVVIHENCNPGAVHKITGFTVNGNEHVLWQGKDPTAEGKPRGVSKIKLDTPLIIQKIRIDLKCDQVNGWNEIDAVGLKGADGNIQWATEATASTTYADVNNNIIVQADPQAGNLRIQEKQMAKVIKKLKEKGKQLDEQAKQFAAETARLNEELQKSKEIIRQMKRENEKLRKQVQSLQK